MDDIEKILQDLLGDLLPLETLQTPLENALAKAVIERLEAAVPRYRFDNPSISVALAEQVIQIGKRRERSGEVALGTMLSADSLWQEGKTTNQIIWDMLEEAALLFQEAGDEFGWARTRIGARLLMSYDLQRSSEAFADIDDAEQIFRKYQREDKILVLLSNKAVVFVYLGQFEDALNLLQSALSLAESMGKAGINYLAAICRNIGYSFCRLGNLKEAHYYYQRAYELDKENDWKSGAATSLLGLVWIARSRGNYNEAMRLLHLSEEYCQSSLDKVHLLRNFVLVNLEINRFDEAVNLAKQAISLSGLSSKHWDVGFALLLLAYALEGKKNYADAAISFREASAVFSAHKMQLWQNIAQFQLGRLALKQNNLSEAKETLVFSQEALKASQRMTEYAQAQLLYAQICLREAKLEEAYQIADIGLQLVTETAIPNLQYQFQCLLAQIAIAQNATEQAASFYEAACTTIWNIQQKLSISFRPDFLEDKHEAVHALVNLYFQHGQWCEAFEVIERLKSQIVLGEINNQDGLRWHVQDEKNRILVENLNKLRIEHQTIHHFLNPSPMDNTAENLTPEQRKRLLQDNIQREQQIQALLERLYLGTDSENQRRVFENPSLKQIQSSLKSEELLIEYYDDGRGLYAFIISQKDIEVLELPLSSADYQELLLQLQDKFDFAMDMRDEPDELQALEAASTSILCELYSGLLAKLEDNLADAERLLIVPYAALHYLPFAALFDGSHFLAEKYELLILPAAGLLLQAAPQHQDLEALAIGHSWGGYLPSNIDEATTVNRLCGGELLLEEAANLASLQTTPRKILHIAAHGEYNMLHPQFSFIQLEDGQVFVDDLLQNDMSYELVVLSACETGRAELAPGDELIGLGRGFLYAGAGALLTSLWQIDSQHTERLMEVFYAALLEGQTKSNALALAQQALISNKETRHPIFWAAFQLIGHAEAICEKSTTISEARV